MSWFVIFSIVLIYFTFLMRNIIRFNLFSYVKRYYFPFKSYPKYHIFCLSYFLLNSKLNKFTVGIHIGHYYEISLDFLLFLFHAVLKFFNKFSHEKLIGAHGSFPNLKPIKFILFLLELVHNSKNYYNLY